MLNNKVIQIDSPHTSFNVRLVEKGDKYGRNDAITHNKDEPLVEFFDVRYPHTELGQFVARYYKSTIMEIEGGLILDSSIRDWYVDSEGIEKVQGWLMSME